MTYKEHATLERINIDLDKIENELMSDAEIANTRVCIHESIDAALESDNQTFLTELADALAELDSLTHYRFVQVERIAQ